MGPVHVPSSDPLGDVGLSQDAAMATARISEANEMPLVRVTLVVCEWTITGLHDRAVVLIQRKHAGSDEVVPEPTRLVSRHRDNCALSGHVVSRAEAEARRKRWLPDDPGRAE